MDALSIQLRIGANSADALARHALINELSENLARQSVRRGATAFFHNSFVQSAARTLPLSVEQVGQRVTISRKHINELVHSVFVRNDAKKLAIVAVEDAIRTGVFLRYEASKQSLVPTEMHFALRSLRDD